MKRQNNYENTVSLLHKHTADASKLITAFIKITGKTTNTNSGPQFLIFFQFFRQKERFILSDKIIKVIGAAYLQSNHRFVFINRPECKKIRE
ncbi:hypothetical protein [Xanthovirga aplysinae]|uniref:hypothetical protein n=1 Tax=Xanthovirga aplysinae TaxID=2529853 RepID=UPI0012BB9C4F|nr:hypothetical protein [Xanthovirga aplysinae]MTI29933.1 hypothetical protein [Xanthovirga aplysinae]